MKKIELLSPAGDFECLISAVQNGANAVYFGANRFNARANGTNFDDEELKKAIEYAKLRNVKTHLTLNILIKNNEFKQAMELVKLAYKYGIDAIIVQDLGLAKCIIENFPNLEVHASTQMTIYNAEGVKELEQLGFKRAVLARELNIEEITQVCNNSNIEIETFIHGALCISYSGQCLMSSMIGGRSGNRGKCAGTCRLPYELLKDNKNIEKGYLLSSKDVCGLAFIPELIKAGVKSLKIEGRMKSPEYVGVVTSIYRKYIDLAYSDKEYKIEEQDYKKLLQIFNRGGFSAGYINGKLGKNMMYTEKPNHLGVYIGQVIKTNTNKGYVDVKLETDIDLGDSIAINDSSCKISELMEHKQNIKNAKTGKVVTIGRIKGNIRIGDKIYKTVSQKQISEILNYSSKENIKRLVDCTLKIKLNQETILQVQDLNTKLYVKVKGALAQNAITHGITEERLAEQLTKTGNTIFKVDKINFEVDKDASLPIKEINELRRKALEELQESIIKTFSRQEPNLNYVEPKSEAEKTEKQKVSVLLNNIKEEFLNLEEVDRLYIPISQVIANENIANKLINKFETYVFFPAIMKSNYIKLTENVLQKISNKITGIIISNLSQIVLAKKYTNNIIANYTMNIFNNYTEKELRRYGINTITISPEMSKTDINNLNNQIKKEQIVYGRTLLMTSEYCPIGSFKDCQGKCQEGKYLLKDRMNFNFPIYTDRINCNSKIYNSKITSITKNELNIDSIRFDILEENVYDANKIIKLHKQGNRLEGNEYTNGNINKTI